MAAGGVLVITTAVRERLAQLLGEQLSEPIPAVLPYGVTGPFQPPAVVIGMPDVEFGEWGCTDKSVLGMAVVVRDHPDGPVETQRELDELWPRVAQALKAIFQGDPTLGGLVTHAELRTAEYGSLLVQGRTFPAQQLTTHIYT